MSCFTVGQEVRLFAHCKLRQNKWRKEIGLKFENSIARTFEIGHVWFERCCGEREGVFFPPLSIHLVFFFLPRIATKGNILNSWQAAKQSF